MLKPFATKIDQKDLAQLDHLAKKTQMPKARLVTHALQLLFKVYHAPKRESLAEKVRKDKEEFSKGEVYTMDEVSARLRAIEKKLGIAG